MRRVWRWLLLLFVAPLIFGCATVRDRAVASMNGVATFADGAHDHLADRYKAALKSCVDRADTKPKALSCGKDVDERFDPMWTAYRVVRSLWVLLAATINAADLAGEDLDELDVLAMLVKLGGAVNDFRAALQKGVP